MAMNKIQNITRFKTQATSEVNQYATYTMWKRETSHTHTHTRTLRMDFTVKYETSYLQRFNFFNEGKGEDALLRTSYISRILLLC